MTTNSSTLRAASIALARSASLPGSTAYASEIATAEQRAARTPDAVHLFAAEILNTPAITAWTRKNRENLSPATDAIFPKQPRL